MTPRRAPSITYCVVAGSSPAELRGELSRHWLEDPAIRVVIERRQGERRGASRRLAAGCGPPEGDRRKLRSETGRRLADRRAATVLVATPPALPLEAIPHADHVVFVERLDVGEQKARDVRTLRLVLRLQSGDESAFADLYLGHFDQVCSYLRTALGDFHEAEDVTQRVFLRVLRALPRYEVRPAVPFRAWLFRIARNEALRQLRGQGIVEVEDPTTVERRRDSDPVEERSDTWDWLSDAELSEQMELLPLAQRQALTLRHLVGFNVHEIGMVLDRTPEAVRMLEHRAMRSLRERLTQGGFRPNRSVNPRTPMLARVRIAPVLRGRRFALNASRPAAPLALGRAAWRAR
jgi:RNA polymerase sigma-70 factor (ECF subfamily)